MFFIFFVVALAAAGAGADPPADAEVFARIEAGEIARALELAQLAIDKEAAEPGGSPAELADHLQRFAERFYGADTKESIDAARRFYERALSLRQARADQDPAPLADLLHDLSTVYFNEGDYDRSEDAERRALSIRERIYPPGDIRIAKSRRDLGLVFMAQGRLHEASYSLQEALRAIEASSSRDPRQLAAGQNYLAELYRLQGKYAEAASLLERLVSQAPEAPGAPNPDFPSYLNNLAGVYRDQDRFDEAETLLRRSLTLRKAASPRDDGDIAVATLNLAELYRAQGKPADAEPLYAEALQLARKAFPSGSSMLFEFINQSAVLFREQGRLEEAEPRFREALELVEGTLGPDHARVAQSQLDLAELLRLRGRCAEAEIHYRKAAEIRRKTLGPHHPDVAEAMTGLAECLAPAPSRRDDARASLDEAIGILGGSEAHPAVSVEALALRAELTHASDPVGARRDLADALQVVESMRPHRGGGEGVRAEFFGRYAPLYERMVRWDVEAGRMDLALVNAERGRARALLDQLAASHVGDKSSLPPELAGRQVAARAELAEIRERMTFEASRADLNAQERVAHIEAFERRLEEATRSFRELYDESRNANPAWRGAAAGEPASVDEIQRDVVPRKGLLLLYEFGEQGSFVFTVPPVSGAIEAKALVVGPDDAATLGIEPGPLTKASLGSVLSGGASPGLLSHLASPRGALSRGIGGLSTGSDPELKRLHSLWRVLVPSELWARVLGAEEVLVVPDGPLFLLPLEALVVQTGPDLAATRFWLDAGPVLRYAPSATFVHELRRRVASSGGQRSRATALSVSDPAYSSAAGRSGSSSVRGAYLGGGGILSRLPATASETRAVRAALGPVAEVAVLQGRAASESAVRKEIVGKRYVHIATHGLVDQERGELFATLALAPPLSGAPTGDNDGFLQLFEIYDLRLDAELAVLSACNSNTGRVISGEGVFALSRGFLVAGARRVVASQWPVDDTSTAELVGELFRRVAGAEKLGGGIDSARALRDAKLRLRRKAEWAHPFFWAPFVLTGLE